MYVNETAEVLNIIIHALYSMSSARHSPSFDIIVVAIDRMSRYAINPRDHIIPSNPLHGLLIHFAPLYPLEVYALAARYDVYDIAESTSSHLLSYSLDTISDEMASRMGAVYLKRLLCLHVSRFNALKNIVLVPPYPHPPTTSCDFENQQKLTRAWALVASYLAWDARPGPWRNTSRPVYTHLTKSDLSVHSMQAAFNPLHDQLTCRQCQYVFMARMRDVASQWASVKVRLF